MNKAKRWLIETLGGFPTIDDAITAIQEKDGKEKLTILTLAVRRLYNTIGADDILRENERGEWVSEGKVLSKGVVDLVTAEARAFEGSTLWRVLQRDVQWQSNRRMFILGKTEMDMAVGKLWLYSFDAIRTRLNSIVAGSGKFNTTQKG